MTQNNKPTTLKITTKWVDQWMDGNKQTKNENASA